MRNMEGKYCIVTGAGKGIGKAIAKRFAEDGTKPDVIVVDPPRKGLEESVIDSIVYMAPDRVVYVSCDPATLARDIKRFAERGFSMTKAEAFDMFPRCHHCEAVVCLNKKA